MLSNDQGVGLKITQVNTTSIQLGSVSISEDGQKLLYTPAQDFSGNDEFWYVFSDSWGRSNAGKVTPIVQAEVVNTPWPTATPDYANTISTRSVLIPVLKNDVGDDLSLNTVNTTTVGLGKASIEGDYIRYVPPANYSGQDSFWYDFVDSKGRANSTQIFVDVTKNTELSSLSFCGTNYFTDGTVENTSTSNSPTDASASELSTSPEALTFSAPNGTFAVVGERQYFLETQDDEQLLIVEENGERSTVRTFSTTESVYGIGVRDNNLYLAYIPDDQYDYPSGISILAKQHIMLTHDGDSTHTLGTYLLLSGNIEMLATTDNTLVRFVGYENIGEGPEVIEIRKQSPYQYHEIFPEDNKSVYLASHSKFSYATAKTSTITALDALVFDQHLVSSIRNVVTGRSAGTSYQLRSSNSVGLFSYPYARLDKAIISNDRLLLTTIPHTNDVSSEEVNPSFPAKLFSFDSFTGQFTELASCE